MGSLLAVSLPVDRASGQCGKSILQQRGPRAWEKEGRFQSSKPASPISCGAAEADEDDARKGATAVPRPSGDTSRGLWPSAPRTMCQTGIAANRDVHGAFHSRKGPRHVAFTFRALPPYELLELSDAGEQQVRGRQSPLSDAANCAGGAEMPNGAAWHRGRRSTDASA